MKKVCLGLILLGLCFGCSQMEPQFSPNDQTNTASSESVTSSYLQNDNEEKDAKQMKPDELVQIDRFKDLKIIKTGSMTIEVDDFKETRNHLDSLIALHHGFISKENANKPNDRMQTTITVKLLPDQFYPFFKNVEHLGLKVHAKNINTRDVTQEYTDLEARLKAREDIAERYKAILKRANTINEIFTVEGKLRTVLEDIEAMKGRIRYLSEQVGLSTMTVTIFQYLPIAEVAEAGFFKKLGHAFTFGWNDILEVILNIASNWHLLLLWGTIFFFGYRWLRNRDLVKIVREMIKIDNRGKVV